MWRLSLEYKLFSINKHINKQKKVMDPIIDNSENVSEVRASGVVGKKDKKTRPQLKNSSIIGVECQ